MIPHAERLNDLPGFVGLRVRVYRNLRAKCYSVLMRGRVVAHCEQVTLGAVEFLVSKAGHARALRQRRKNVHAFVDGVVSPPWVRDVTYRQIRYDIYSGPQFMEAGLERPLTRVVQVRLSQYGAHAGEDR